MIMRTSTRPLYAMQPGNDSIRGLHGNGDSGNTAVTAVMGTTFTVIPWGRGHVSRGYRGDGDNADGNTAVKWKRDEQ